MGYERASQILREMADRVELNDEGDFGGVIVIIPPPQQGEVGEAVELLLIDPGQDLANFWSTVQGKANNAADEFKAQQQIPAMGRY
jgi:hypothetical protein